MTTATSTHAYAARILDAGGDIALWLDEDSPGSVSLDASRIPHVEGNLTVALGDLDQIDPRNGRRVVIEAKRADTSAAVYTPWIEQRRNQCRTPRPTAFVGSTWGAPANFQGVPEVGWIGGTLTVSTTPYIFSATSARAYAAGEKVTLSIRYRVTAANTGTAQHISVIPHVRSGNAYYRGQHVTRPMVVGQDEDVVVQWTTPVAIAAGQLDIAVVGSNAAGTGFAAADAGFGIQATCALIEDGWTDGAFFDGDSNPSGDLARTRWIGTVNASESIIETRSLDHFEPVYGPARVFDLGVRRVVPDHATGTATLTLASDEALLGDFAQLVQDRTPRTLETSLRAICNYVLGKIGAGLVYSATDAVVTAQWALDNLAVDPRCTAVTSTTFGGATATLAAATGISSVLGTGATTCATATLTADAPAWGELRKTLSVSAGESYSFRVAGRFSIAGGGTASRNAWARIFWLDKDGNPLGEVSGAPVVLSDPGAGSSPWAWCVLGNVKAPPGATQARCIFRVNGPLTSGSTVEATCWQLVAEDELVPYFDGYTANDAVYAYTWTGDANLSTSHREPVIERDPDALVWQPGQSGLDFLTPLLKANGLRLVCDERRVWTLRASDYRPSGLSSWRWGINLTALEDEITIDSDDGWFDAAVYTYRWTGRDGIPRVRRDTFKLTASPRKVATFDLTTPWPGPGRAEAMVRRAQDRGRVTTVGGVPLWTEHAEQALQIALDSGALLTGTIGAVTFDLSDDTLRITSRTTIIPVGSIDLLPGTIDALTGTIDTL